MTCELMLTLSRSSLGPRLWNYFTFIADITQVQSGTCRKPPETATNFRPTAGLPLIWLDLAITPLSQWHRRAAKLT